MHSEIRGNTQIITGSISKHQVDSTLIRADGVNPFTADQSMGSHHLTNLLDPTNPQDAATKNYADSLTGATPYDGTPQDVAAAGASGSSALYSRGDHIHKGVHSLAATGSSQIFGDALLAPGRGIALSESGQQISIISTITGTSPYDSLPADVASAGDAGTSILQSHGDHVHRGLHSAQATGSSAIYGDLYLIPGDNITLFQSGQNIKISGAGATGTVSLSDVNPQDVGSSASAGVDSIASRDDHVHRGLHSLQLTGSSAIYGDAFLTPGPGIDILESSPVLRISSTITGTSPYDSTPADVSSTGAPGVSLQQSHGDHVHKGVHSVQLTGSAAIYGDMYFIAGPGIDILETSPVLKISSNVTGTSPYDATPADVGSTGLPGTSLLQSHGDHVHKGVHSISATGSSLLYGDVMFQGQGSVYVSESGQVVYISGSSSGAVPAASQLGQVLISEDASSFSVALPLVGDDGGWLTNEDGVLLVVG